MSQIIIDGIRKFKFRIGWIIKVGDLFLEIKSISPLNHYELVTSVTTLLTADQSFDDNLRPSPNHAYWIEFIGIDGALGFQLKFPEVPHWTVHGLKKYYFRHQASRDKKKYLPFLITYPNYPRFTFKNPETTDKESIIYFTGEHFKVREVNVAREGRPEIYTELTEYAEGGVGEG